MKTIVLAVVLATLILSSNIYGQEKGKDGNLAEAQLKIQIVIGKNVLSATGIELLRKYEGSIEVRLEK
jgi:hypothetical protein